MARSPGQLRGPLLGRTVGGVPDLRSVRRNALPLLTGLDTELVVARGGHSSDIRALAHRSDGHRSAAPLGGPESIQHGHPCVAVWVTGRIRARGKVAGVSA